MLIDFNQDGHRSKAVMAARIFIKRTPKGYRGYMVRGLYDIEAKKVAKYYLTMTPDGRPVYTDDTIALSNIRVDQKTIRFDLGDLHYTLRDGGEGFADDEMSVILRGKRKRIRLYGGDIKIHHTAEAKHTRIKWKKIPDVAQYGGADWKNEVMHLSGISLERAKTIAAANPKITYFFYMKSGVMYLSGNPDPNNGWTAKGMFLQGDAVFFSGKPWYGSATGFADAYEKQIIRE